MREPVYLYTLADHRPIALTDVNEWALAFAALGDDRIVAQETVGRHWVSTVFLGIDHHFGQGRPHLFETAVFDEDNVNVRRRYATWEEAERGHAEIVAEERGLGNGT